MGRRQDSRGRRPRGRGGQLVPHRRPPGGFPGRRSQALAQQSAGELAQQEMPLVSQAVEINQQGVQYALMCLDLARKDRRQRHKGVPAEEARRVS